MKILDNLVIPLLVLAFLTSCSSSQEVRKASDQDKSANKKGNKPELKVEENKLSQFNIESIRLQKRDELVTPDGEATFDWTIRITNYAGLPLQGIFINFDVQPVFPQSRDVMKIATQYGNNSHQFLQRIKTGQISVLGKVSPSFVITDSNGLAKTNYKVSNIGSNDEIFAKEKIVARIIDENIDTVINIGYEDLVQIPTVEGGLQIFKATGRYVHNNLVEFLLNLGMTIRELNWPYPLYITAGSLKWGGLYPPHFGHRDGGALDISPVSTDGKATWCNPDGKYAANYDRRRTLGLIKLLHDSGATQIYFNDPEAKRLGAVPLADHSNHVHVSWSSKKQVLVPKDGMYSLSLK